MKTFLHTPLARIANTSRRSFVLGSAAVAGSGLALGLPAAWSSSVDALGLADPNAIKLTTFTRADLEQSTRSILPDCGPWWGEEDCPVEALDGRSHGTPISSALVSQALRFFSGPDRIDDIGFDYADLMFLMKGGGRSVEWSARPTESYLSPEAIVDRIMALWAYAHKSGPIFATNFVVLVLSRRDHPRDGRWNPVQNSLWDALGDDAPLCLEASIDAGDTAAVSLWIEEAKR